MADITSYLPDADKADGVDGAAAPSVTTQVGGKDGSGNLQTILTDTTGAQVVLISDKSGTGTIVALNGTIVFTNNSCSTVIFNLTGTWSATIIFEGQNGDNVWNPILGYVPGQGVVADSLIVNASLIFPCGGFTQVRARASSYSSGTVTVTYNASIGYQGSQIFNLQPASLLGTMNIRDNSGNGLASTNGQLQTRDVINVSSQYRAQSITTTAAEAIGAATRLVNRKVLCITPTNGTIYWATSNSVTTATGHPLFANQTLTLEFTDNVPVYVISAGTVDSRILEGS